MNITYEFGKCYQITYQDETTVVLKFIAENPAKFQLADGTKIELNDIGAFSSIIPVECSF